MNNFLDYGKSSIEYKHSSYLFSILYHDIQHIMCMYRKDRPYAITYIQNSIKQYDHLEITGPDIPKYILKQFKSDTSNNVENEDVKSIKSVKNTDDVVEPLHNCFKINNRQNLSNIQDAFSINGDLCEKDNLSINDYNRSRGLNIQSDYETNRFYQI